MARWFRNLCLSFLIVYGSASVAGAPGGHAQPAFQDHVEELYGVWRNVNGSGRSISRISVEPSGSGVKVRVFGDCGSRECDWGVQHAVVYEGDPKAQGEPRNAVNVKFENDVAASHLIIMRNPRNKGLVVQVFSRDRSGRDHGPDEIKPTNGDTYSIERFERTSEPIPYASHEPRQRHDSSRDGVSSRDGGPYPEGGPYQDRAPHQGAGPYKDSDPRAGREPDPHESHVNDRRGDDRNNRYAGGDIRFAGGDGRPYDGERDRYAPEGRGDGPPDPRDEEAGRPDRFGYGVDGPNAGGWRRSDGPGDCVRFDPDRIELSRAQGGWKIVDGRRWLFEFGGARDEAEVALDLLRHYHVDQSCSVGRGDGRFTYLLRGGEPLNGRFDSEDCDRFNLQKLRVKRIDGNYWIVEGRRTLYDFGARDDEAERALEVIQKYGFGASCHAGRSGGGMRYLRR